MAYNVIDWKDHVVTPDHTFTITDNGDGTYTLEPAGEIIQQGTNMSAANFNNDESGIHAAYIAGIEAIRLLNLIGDSVDSISGFSVEATLKNSQAYPFNNSQSTIAFESELIRYNKDYIVIVESEDYEGGFVGDIEVTDKMLNGFKLAYTGSASSVDFKCYILGGR